MNNYKKDWLLVFLSSITAASMVILNYTEKGLVLSIFGIPCLVFGLIGLPALVRILRKK